MQLRNYYGFYKVGLILIIFTLMVLLTGMLTTNPQVELITRLALFMGVSLGTLMGLTNLKIYSSRLNKTRARGALWQAFGIPMIWTAWSFLLVIIAFKYI